MTINNIIHSKIKSGRRAQAMVEFAIALPVLFALLLGIMEVGRLMLMYTLVVNASRESVRFASAFGRGDDGYIKYKNCLGIKNMAQQAAVFIPLSSVTINYYNETGGGVGVCDKTTSGEDSDISVDTNYTVKVTVQAQYSPMVSFLPIGSRTITSTSTRTILGIFDLPNP
jgi:Flp pilus assembly protein TadG